MSSEERSFTFLWKIETSWELVLNSDATLHSPIIEAANAKWILEVKVKEQLDPICKLLCLRLKNVNAPPDQIDCELSFLAPDDTVLRRFRITKWKEEELCVDRSPLSEVFDKCQGSLRIRCRFGHHEGRRDYARTVFSSGIFYSKEKWFYRPNKRYFKTSKFQLGSRSLDIRIFKGQQFLVDRSVEVKIFFDRVDDLQFVHCKVGVTSSDQMQSDVQGHEFFYTEKEHSWTSLIPLRPQFFFPDETCHFKFEVTIATNESWVDPFLRVLRDAAVGRRPNDVVGVRCLSDDLARMHEDRKFCDVTLTSSSDEEFPAHKSILSARSSLFQSKFDENDAIERVRFPNVDSSTLSAMLRYMYSGRTDLVEDWKDACRLYKAARRYAVRDLQRECLSVLGSGLNVANVCEALTLCSSSSELRASICEFVRDHEDEVMDSKAWKELEEKKPGLAILVLKNLRRKKSKK